VAFYTAALVSAREKQIHARSWCQSIPLLRQHSGDGTQLLHESPGPDFQPFASFVVLSFILQFDILNVEGPGTPKKWQLMPLHGEFVCCT
jgi:hypothetical protein